MPTDALSIQAPKDAHDICIDLLKEILIDDDDYERMKDLDTDKIAGPEYDDFVKFNIHVISEYSYDECVFFAQLGKMLQGRKIKIQDMECCGAMSVGGVYFNTDKKLVLCCPR